ncbi:hypothetical protein OPV22_013455 [Ensete ventricosum]|uniref:Cytochrome P450 n=1 Tax=Ensete ventricosum TaxID=4639 RepID=A0AAV8PN60_ENSVE|nr:hypothetical protein OPV22_013455 [Ensete ventricosum]
MKLFFFVLLPLLAFPVLLYCIYGPSKQSKAKPKSGPDRWLNKDGEYRPMNPFRFPVFHAGPRMCLGKDMAYIQMKAVAASVMEKFEIEVVDKERERELEYIMILRLKGGLPVRVRERND